MFAGDFPRRKALADEALAIARRLDDPATVVHVIHMWAQALMSPDTLADSQAVTAEAIVLAESLGDPAAAYWTNQVHGYCALEVGERDEADRCRTRMEALAEQIGQPTLRYLANSHTSGMALLDGRVEEAEALINNTLELGQASGQPDVLTIYGAGLLTIRWHQGREAELTEVLTQLAADAPDLPMVRSGVALVLAGAGRGGEITIGPAELDALPIDSTWLLGMAIWAEVAARLQDADAAAALYERLAPYPSYVAVQLPICFGAVAHALGALAAVLGRYDDAERHFAQAETIHERLRAPFHLARTHVEWGRMLLARDAPGDRQRATELLERALAAARQYGCGGVERRAAEALAAATRTTLPPALVATGQTFVGRDGELDQLRVAWTAASAGQRQVVLVGGEPGIGKTSLAAALAAAVHVEGATVLYGACEEELGVPYQPFAEALRAYVAACPAGVLQAHVGRAGGDLARLVPELTARSPDAPPPMQAEAESERYRMFEAAADLLGAAAAQAPVLLVLDDLQWATKATLLLLRHLLRVGDERRALLVVCLYRDTEAAGELVDVLADLARVPGVERLGLQGVSEEAVGELLEVAGLAQAEGDLARRLHTETQGSPFFVSELLRHLADAGTIGDAAGLSLPPNVRAVIDRRVRRLAESTRQVLTTAAVIGPSFDLRVLQAASDDAENLVDALEEAVTAGMVRELPAPGTFAFAHDLVRQALYEKASALRRARLHHRIADAIEELPGQADARLPELASHYLAAVAGGTADKAIEYAIRAGQSAIDRVAYDEAMRFFEQALEVLDFSGESETARACDVLLALADAHWRSGDTLGSRETYGRAADLARRLGDAERLASAALRNLADLGGFTRSLRMDHNLVSLLEEALEAIGEDDSARRVQLLARLAVELYFEPDPARRVDVSRQAVAMAERLGDPQVLLFAMHCREWATVGPDTPIDARLAAAESIALLAEELGDFEVAYQARYLRLLALMEAGDFDAGDQEADKGACLGDKLRVPGFLPWVGAHRAWRAWMAGRIADAQRLNQEALDEALATKSDPGLVFAQIGGQGLVFTYLRRSEMEAAIPVLAEVAAQPDVVEANPAISVALCLLYGLAGQTAKCQALFDDIAQRGLANIPRRDGSWLNDLAMRAMTCGFLRAADEAVAIYEMLAPFADRWASASAANFGPMSRHLGVLATILGRYDDAERHLLDAIERTAAASTPIFHAEACYDYAVLLAQRDQPGERERAREYLDRCEATAIELELTTLLEWAAELRRRVDA